MYGTSKRYLRQYRQLFTPLLVIAALTTASCKKEKEATKGTLVVPFQLGSGKSCDEVSIAKVKATLDEDAYDEEITCSKKEIRFDNVESGIYSLKLYGYDSEGHAIMDSMADEIKVEEDNTVTVDPPVVLSDAPGQIRLRWDLGFGNCKIWDLKDFQLNVWSEDGNKLALETSIACDDNKVDDDVYRTVPDPDRRLDGTNLGALQLQPRDANGTALGGKEPVKFKFSSPGPGGLVKLSVKCDDDGCEGSGEADE